MLRLYLRTDPSIPYSAVTPVWRNFCDHLNVQMHMLHPGLPDRGWQQEWNKVRDSHLAQWQAQLCPPDNQGQGSIKASYLEFADAESLTAFELAWS